MAAVVTFRLAIERSRWDQPFASDMPKFFQSLETRITRLHRQKFG
jgi:hypothetical protein